MLCRGIIPKVRVFWRSAGRGRCAHAVRRRNKIHSAARGTTTLELRKIKLQGLLSFTREAALAQHPALC